MWSAKIGWILWASLAIGCGKSQDGPPAATTAPAATPGSLDAPATKRTPTPAAGTGAARCNPVFGDHRLAAAEASLRLTVAGEPVTVALDPAASYRSPPLVRDATHAICVGMERTDPNPGGGWLVPRIHAIFHDGAGRPLMTLVVPPPSLTKRGQPLPHVQLQQAADGPAGMVRFKTGTVAIEPEVASCGGKVTIKLDGLAGTVGPRGDTPVTLDGTLSLTLPAAADDPALREAVAPLVPCERDDKRLDAVSSSDQARLPFAGSCWSGGDDQRTDVWTLAFRARPASARFDPFASTPWTLRFVIPAARDLAPGATLTVAVPDALMAPGSSELGAGTAWATVSTPLDGVGGPDWRATGGKITITKLTEHAKPDSMFKRVELEADFQLDLRHLGPCNEAPALTGDPVTVRGRLVVADKADD